MRKNVKYIVVISIVLLTVIVFLLGAYVKRRNQADGIRVIFVGGLPATWQYIERDISLDYFYQLDNTTTYRQIVQELGEPNGSRGSGLVMPYWQIDDEFYAVISFSWDEAGEYDKVGLIYTCGKDGEEEIIYSVGRH